MLCMHKNIEHNAITTQVFSKLVGKMHPSISNMNSSVPSFTLVIESSIRKGKGKVSQKNLNAIINHCGNADVITSKNKRIDSASKFYNKIPLMIITNDDLENVLSQWNTLQRLCSET